MKKEINTLVCSGGSVRCITFIGAFKRIEELKRSQQNKKEEVGDVGEVTSEAESDVESDVESDLKPYINIKTVAGVSAGSIFSLMYTVGFSPEEMQEEMLNVRLEKLKEIRFMNFLSKYGLDTGNLIIKWIEVLLAKKGIDKKITFMELFQRTELDLQIFAANVNRYNLTKFNHIQTPDVQVLDAVRMSMSIPFLFTATHFNTDTKKVNCPKGDIHVDGGLIDNYPIYVFKDELDSTLGLKVISNGELDSHNVDERIDDIESYIYHVLACFIIQREKKTTSNELYKASTICIHTEGITQTLNFELTNEEKTRLIQIGYNSTDEFFR
jgi:NTE family protein